MKLTIRGRSKCGSSPRNPTPRPEWHGSVGKALQPCPPFASCHLQLDARRRPLHCPSVDMQRCPTKSNFPWFFPTKCVCCQDCFFYEQLLKCPQAIFTSTDVVQVNISAASGDMGILANHVPSIEPLRPGVVEVIESTNASKKWFSEWYFFFTLMPSADLRCSIWWICYCSSQQHTHH